MSVVVSVIMSTYNCEEYICEAIKSIINQTLQDFELLITDDASIDSTVELINSFDDSRIILFKNIKRRGLTANLIEMEKKAKGKYLARLDSDDIAEPTRLKRQVEYLEKNKNCYMVCSYAKTFGEKKGIIKPPIKYDDLKTSLLFYNPIVHSSVMFRNDCNIFYDSFFLKAQDYALWDTMVERGLKFAVIPKKLVLFRYHKKQISNNAKSEQDFFRNIIIIRALKRLSVFLNTDQENAWLRFLCGDRDLSIVQVDYVLNIINEIKIQNGEKRIYDVKAMNKRLKYYYYILFTIIKNKRYKLEKYRNVKKLVPFYKKILLLFWR